MFYFLTISRHFVFRHRARSRMEQPRKQRAAHYNSST